MVEQHVHKNEWLPLDAYCGKVYAQDLSIKKQKRFTSAMQLALCCTVTGEQSVAFKSLDESLLTDAQLREFQQAEYADVPTTGAILGSLMAQDVIRVVSGRGQPIQQLLSFDAATMKAEIA